MCRITSSEQYDILFKENDKLNGILLLVNSMQIRMLRF